MNVAETILSRGRDAAPAVLQKDSVVTHGELRRTVTRLAGGLLARGHVKGDRIGIWAENSPFFITAYLAVIRAGMVAVPFQTDISAEMFGRIAVDAGITEVLVSRRHLGRLFPAAEKAKIKLLPETGLKDFLGDASARMPEIDPARDLAALMFTSGSTGAPKGVMITHRNIECNTRDIITYMGLGAEDRAMVVLPFHYCFGASLLHTHLMAGGSLVLNNDFKLFPETVLQELFRTECTGLAGVPSTYQILLRKSRFRELLFPKLRWFQQAGGKLPDPYIADLTEAFPEVRYYLMYGQTEGTARLSYLPPERLRDKLGSIGRGLPSTKLAVVRADGGEVPAGSEEIGEIVASGDNIASGYWNDPAETASYFRNGRLHTGDLARVDADGFIFVVEREREMIKSGGNRVSAKEVENVIAELGGVVEVAVLGTPHELLGEAIVAFVAVAPKSELTPGEVQGHCRRRLPPYKMPEEVLFVLQLPHNSAGKVMKAKLKEQLANRAGAQAAPAAPSALSLRE